MHRSTLIAFLPAIVAAENCAIARFTWSCDSTLTGELVISDAVVGAIIEDTTFPAVDDENTRHFNADGSAWVTTNGDLKVPQSVEVVTEDGDSITIGLSLDKNGLFSGWTGDCTDEEGTTFATLGGDSNWHTDDEIEADSSLLEIHCDAPEIDKSSTPPQYEFEPGMCYSNPRYCWVQMLNGLPKYNCRPDWGPPSPCKRNAQPEPVEMQIEARDAGAEAEADDDSFDTIQKRCNYFNQNWKNRCCEHQVLVKATSPCHAPKDPCLWFARARLGTVL